MSMSPFYRLKQNRLLFSVICFASRVKQAILSCLGKLSSICDYLDDVLTWERNVLAAVEIRGTRRTQKGSTRQ